MKSKYRNFLEHMDDLDKKGEAYQVRCIFLTSGNYIALNENMDVVSRSDTHICVVDPQPGSQGEYLWIRLADIQCLCVVEL